MASYTIFSYLYYSGSPTWTNAGFSVGSDVSTFIEQVGSDNSLLEPGEVLDTDYGSTNVTYVGTLSHAGNTFLVIENDNFSTGQLLVSIEPGLVKADFPTTFDVTSSAVDRTSAADVPTCFLSGTAISTPDGAVAVESLAIGDLVLTAGGTSVPVRWIGRQRVVTMFDVAERLRPVRVRAGALGQGLPERDLVLTSDHALLIDDVLVNAGALVNGATIDWVPLSEFGGSYTVYHIETEAHDIILAEGAPAETYIDYIARRAFGNYAEYLELYGDDRTIPEMTYPRVSSQRMLPPQLRQRLADAA